MNIGKFHYWHSVIIIFLCFNCLYLKSNDTITVHRNNLLFSFSNVHIEDDYLLQDNMISLQLEYNLNLKDYLSVGCNAGFGLYEEWLFERDSTSISITYLDVAKSFQYGLNSNLYILPLIFETKIPRFDLYISGELGLVSLFSSKDNNIVPERGHYFDYSLMGGGSIYLSKKFGLFAEAGYKNFKYHRGFNTKYGLTFRF